MTHSKPGWRQEVIGGEYRASKAESQWSDMACRFEIEPRPLSLGGGWRLRLLQDEMEMGGGVFPIQENATSDDAYADALETGEDWLSSVSS